MSTLKKITLSLGLLSLAACASTPGQKDDADRQARSKAFVEGLQSRRAVDASGSCHAVPANAKTMATAQTWKSLVDEASACVKSNDWQAVDAWAFELSRSYADSPWGLYFFSVSAEANKDHPRALWMIEAAIKKTGTDIAIFRYQKARVLWSMKPTETALKEAQAALDLDATLIDAHNFLGDARLRTEDFKQATHHYESALKLSATDTHALKGLEMVQTQTGQAPSRAVASPDVAINSSVKKESKTELKKESKQ